MRHIKKLLFFLISIAFLCANPAFASFTHVTGSGGGGSIITPSFIPSSSGGVATTASTNVGDVVVIEISNFEAGTNSSNCANADGSGLNTWLLAPGGAIISSAGKQIWYSILAHAIANGTTLTCSSDAVDFIYSASAFRPGGTGAYDTNASAKTGTGSGITVGPTPLLACPSGASNCGVCIGGLAWSAASTLGSDATFTTIGGTGAGQQFLDAWRFVSATTAINYATTGGSGNYAGALACFKDTPAASTIRAPIMRNEP